MQVTTEMKVKTEKELLEVNAKKMATRLQDLPKSEITIDHEEIARNLSQIDLSNLALVQDGTTEADKTQIIEKFKQEQHRKLLDTGERQQYKLPDHTKHNTFYDTPVFDSRFHLFILQRIARAFYLFNKNENQQAGKLQMIGGLFNYARSNLIKESSLFKELKEFLSDDGINTPIHIESVQFILLTNLIIETLDETIGHANNVGTDKLTLKNGLLNKLEDNIGVLPKIATDALKHYVQASTNNNDNIEALIITSQPKPISDFVDSKALEYSMNLIKKMVQFQKVLSATINLILHKIDALQLDLPKKKELAGIVLHVVGKYFENPYKDFLRLQPPTSATVINSRLSQKNSSSDRSGQADLVMDLIEPDDSALMESDSSRSSASSSRKSSVSKKETSAAVITANTDKQDGDMRASDTAISSASLACEGVAAANIQPVRKGSAPQNVSPQSLIQAPPMPPPSRKVSTKRQINVIPTEGDAELRNSNNKPQISNSPEISDQDKYNALINNAKGVVEELLNKYADQFQTITNDIHSINTIKYNSSKLFTDCLDNNDSNNNPPLKDADFIPIQALRADLQSLITCQKNVFTHFQTIEDLAKKYPTVENYEQRFKGDIEEYKKIYKRQLDDLSNTLVNLTCEPIAGIDHIGKISQEIDKKNEENSKRDGSIKDLNDKITKFELENEDYRRRIVNVNAEIDQHRKILREKENLYNNEKNGFEGQRNRALISVIEEFNRRFTYRVHRLDNFTVKENDVEQGDAVDKVTKVAKNIAKRFWDGVPFFGWFFDKCTGETAETRLTAATNAIALIANVNIGDDVSNDASGFLIATTKDSYTTARTNFIMIQEQYNTQNPLIKASIKDAEQGKGRLDKSITTNIDTIAEHRVAITNHTAAKSRNASKIEKLQKARNDIIEIKEKLLQQSTDSFNSLQAALALSNEKVATNKSFGYRI